MSSSGHNENTRSRENIIHEIYTISEQCECVNGELSHTEQHTAFSRRSLLQEIKHAKEIFKRAFYNTHTVISAGITANYTVDSPHTESPSSSKLKQQLNMKNMEIMTNISSQECSSIIPKECSSILSTDDILVRDMTITVRSGLKSHGNGSDQNGYSSTIIDERNGLMCIENALVTASVVSFRDTKNMSNSVTQSHLIVLCRSLSDIQDNDCLYCAKVCLTNNSNQNENEKGESDLSSAMGCVKKIRLYVGPSSGRRCLPDSSANLTGDFLSSDEDTIEDVSWRSGNEECEDDVPIRAAAVVCVGIAKSVIDGQESITRTCLMRVDLKDLVFTAVSPPKSSSDNIENNEHVRNVDCNSVLNVTVQYLGCSEDEVVHRERLLDLELPLDNSRIILEACAARGVVVVGCVSSGMGGGRAIVVDMENDEEVDDEEEGEEGEEVEEKEENEEVSQSNDIEIGDTTCVSMTTH